MPHLTAKVYFLTDASAQSASETLLGQIKDFKLATIIGQPTSGTNGNINMIYLPGRYSIGYTGLLTKNNDGSKHHLAGIIPDVIINPTLKGISSGKDEILEEAIRICL
ncbi:S41 family peptidase [Pedobacter sp. NJ-S-72]